MAKLIEQSVTEIIEADSFKKAELCGRVCYKSEDKISEDSSYKFIKRITDNGHTSVLEHVQFVVPMECTLSNNNILYFNFLENFKNFVETYSYCKMFLLPCKYKYKQTELRTYKMYMIGNWRAFLEFFDFLNSDVQHPFKVKFSSAIQFAIKSLYNTDFVVKNIWFSDSPIEDCFITKYTNDTPKYNMLEEYPEIFNTFDHRTNTFSLSIMTKNSEKIPEYLNGSILKTFRIITDRGISHELVRHRVASFSQESTRYCNYAGNEIEFIKPPGDWSKIELEMIQKKMQQYEDDYNYLVNRRQIKPQIARNFLPNALKTELIMSATRDQWKEIIKLRSSKGAHPQVREIAKMIEEQIQ